MAEALVETTSDLANMVKGSPSQYVKVACLNMLSGDFKNSSPGTILLKAGRRSYPH